MEFTKLGRHDIQVSRIGLGGHREGVDTRDGIARTVRFFRSDQDRARVVGRAIDGGVTYFDTTYGCELASLGQSLRILRRRDGLLVSGMRVDFFSNLLRDGLKPRAYTRREVEGRLRDFGMGPIDQFLLGAIDGGDPLSGPAGVVDEVMAELEKLKKEGSIRFIGFSCHDPDYAARMLLAWPQFDTVMVPYNFFNRKAEGALADALRKTGAAFVAMKPLVWAAYGLPITLLRNLPSPVDEVCDPRANIGALAMRFILANPQVTSIVPAMNSVAEVDENLSAAGAGPLGERDLTQLQAYSAAMQTDQMMPLAIAGMLQGNLRVLSCALGLAKRALNLTLPPIDFEADDAEATARQQAADVLSNLQKDERWSRFVQ